MKALAYLRINYKSDFILTLHSDAGWMTPFCIKFWTSAPSQAYFAGWDGDTYTHCTYDPSEPTKLVVQFDDHHLPIGDLKFQIAYHFTVADFPNDVEDEVLNQSNIVTEIDGNAYQVMLDFTGETAPEIQFSLPAYANEAQRIANEEQRIAHEAIRIVNEESRIAAETIRQQNEAQRIAQETARVNEFATLKSQSQAATSAANDAATLANQKAQLAADKAALAGAAATLANAKAQLAEDKAALANAAAQLANEKAALAQQKAEYAQQQGQYANEQGTYAKNQGDYAKEQGDTSLADHQRAEADHGIAVDDHTQAGNDHTRAESDHGIAVDDHTQSGNDHTRAESDHGIAADDHTQAGNDHTRAESDHGIAADDHTQAGNDHTRAESDHTRAENDHAAVEVYVDSLGAFDISAYHATGGVLAKYADLTAALGTNGANIPDALRKGGMSVKFVLSSDNNYVQYRLAASNWSTDIHDWTSEDPYFIDKIMQEVNEAIDEHTPIEITGDVTNAPDEEDLTSVNVGGTDVLKFKDKAYNPLTYSGMGRKILRKNIVNGVNTLTQSMMSDANTIYVIQYDFILGEDITIPANCVLEFDGGSLSDKTILGNGATITNYSDSYILKNVEIRGFNLKKLPLTWCGGIPDVVNAKTSSEDNSPALYYALKQAAYNGNIPVLINGDFRCATQIDLDYPLNLEGSNSNSEIPFTPNANKNTHEHSFASRIVVAANTTLFKFVSYHNVNYWYHFDVYKVAFYGDTDTSVLFDTRNIAFEGPARPLNLDKCLIFNFKNVLIATGYNGFNLTVDKCVICYCYEVLVNENKGFGNIHIKDCVIESNGSLNNGTITNRAVIYINDVMGSVIIENNLLEGQPQAIKILCKNGTGISICYNYFENNYSGENYWAYVELTDSGFINAKSPTTWTLKGNSIDYRAHLYLLQDTETDTLKLDIGLNEIRTLYKYTVRDLTPIIDASFFTSVACLDYDIQYHSLSNKTRQSKTNAQCLLPSTGMIYGGYNTVNFNGVDFIDVSVVSAGRVLYTFNNLTINANDIIVVIFKVISNNSGNKLSVLQVLLNGTTNIGSEQAATIRDETFIKVHKCTEAVTSIDVKIANQCYVAPVGIYVNPSVELREIIIPSLELFMPDYFRKSGLTTQRPPAQKQGYQYFDETIGKPIWRNGTSWVDATGATV